MQGDDKLQKIDNLLARAYEQRNKINTTIYELRMFRAHQENLNRQLN